MPVLTHACGGCCLLSVAYAAVVVADVCGVLLVWCVLAQDQDQQGGSSTRVLAPAGIEEEEEGWETASEEDLQEGEEAEEWDVCRSLFDNHLSK